MVSREPQDELSVVAGSVADDLSFVALHDISALLGELNVTQRVRVIGGHMVSLHAKRWGLDLYRETQDSDLGVPNILLREADIVAALRKRAYTPQRSNRYARSMEDLPIAAHGVGSRDAVIDVLVPSYTSRPRTNVRVGGIVTIEVPGLAETLKASPVVVTIRMRRLNGQELTARLPLPSEAGALALKAHAWKTRRSPKDAVDMWRCLEIAAAANLSARDFTSADGKAALEIVEQTFTVRSDEAMRTLATERGFAAPERTRIHTRIRALVGRLRGR